MDYRFRNMSDGQVYALYLLLQIVRTKHDAVRLSNQIVQRLCKVGAVHDHRAAELAQSMAPMFVAHKIENWRGHPKTLLLKLTPEETPQNPLEITTLPCLEEIEKELGLAIQQFRTEFVKQTIVRQLQTEDVSQEVVSREK